MYLTPYMVSILSPSYRKGRVKYAISIWVDEPTGSISDSSNPGYKEGENILTVSVSKKIYDSLSKKVKPENK
jgi:hypothetical protein